MQPPIATSATPRTENYLIYIRSQVDATKGKDKIVATVSAGISDLLGMFYKFSRHVQPTNANPNLTTPNLRLCLRLRWSFRTSNPLSLEVYWIRVRELC